MKNGLWTLIVVLALGLSLAACDDGETKTEGDVLTDSSSDGDTAAEDTAPDVTTADTNVTDTHTDEVADTVADTVTDTMAEVDQTETTIACTVGGCATGEACNVVTGDCVVNARCLNAGDSCDPNLEHPAVFACLDDGSGGYACAAACVSDEGCAATEFCELLPGGRNGLCTASDCTGFWDTSCGAGSKCLAVIGGDPLEVQSAWRCMDNILPSLSLGDACTLTPECGDGLACYEGFCNSANCTPTTNTTPCASGSVCVSNDVGALIDVGTCLPYECDVFGANTCGTNEQCNPALYDSVAGVQGGFCELSGSAAQGAGCTDTLDCGAGLICIEQFCRASCDVSATSGAGTCAAGEVCLGFAEVLGFCVPADCEFFASNPCTGQDQCVLEYFVTNTAGAPLGTCQASTGSLTVGETCSLSTDCSDGLLCIDNVCQTLCDPTATNSCGTGMSCVAIFGADAPVGMCWVDECDPDGASTCAIGEMCELINFFADDTGTRLFGTCAPTGTAVAGDACTGWASGECGPGLFCLDDGAGGNFCWARCNADTGSGCATGQTCNAFGPDNNVGYCTDTCTPFTGTECGTGEQCFPDFYTPGIGTCLPTGNGTRGSTCTDTTECADGLVCAGTCELMCDYTASSGAGTCGSDETCVAYAIDGESISFGGCSTACTAGEATSSCDPGEFCAAYVFGAAGTAGDFCATGTPPSTCTGSDLGSLCGDGLSACLDLAGTGSLSCDELCLEAHGAMLQLGHPDCSAPNAICDPSGLAGVGFCI